MLDELLKEYAEKFNEEFPIHSCDYADEEELIGIIKGCIARNKRYKPISSDLLYD